MAIASHRVAIIAPHGTRYSPAVRHLAAAAVLALLVTAAPRPARANGCNTHSWISLHALEHLPDGDLKEMLSRPELRAALINGSVFPDGGYVVDDEYGEIAHWEPFVQAYIEWMREDVPHPFNVGDAAEYTAFLMGLASHGMADQVFDSSFVENARILDAANWSEDLFSSHDTATDVMLVAATGVNFLDTLVWVPTAEIEAIYRDRLGYTVAPGVLDNAQELMHRLVLNYGVSQAMNPDRVQAFNDQYPWTAEHLMGDHEIGAPPCEGEVVASYWLALWDRLHDESGPQNFVIATYPRDGSSGHATDYTSPYAWLDVVFGSGIQEAQLDGHFSVTDSTGKSYELEVGTQWGADQANLVKIKPLEDWAQDETFTVTVLPGLDFNDGDRMTDPLTFTFSTGPGDAGAPTGDPTPHVGEPDVGEVPAAGCCGAGGGGGGGTMLALLLAATACSRRGACCARATGSGRRRPPRAGGRGLR
jgi:hypothetical protein